MLREKTLRLCTSRAIYLTTNSFANELSYIINNNKIYLSVLGVQGGNELTGMRAFASTLMLSVQIIPDFRPSSNLSIVVYKPDISATMQPKQCPVDVV